MTSERGKMTKEEYGKIVVGLNYKDPTPDLATFRACLEYDDNFYFRIPSGHVNNALDEALAEVERLEGAIPTREKLDALILDLKKNHHFWSDSVAASIRDSILIQEGR